MGSSKGSSTSTPVVTEEQKDLLRAQTGFLTNTAFPAYQSTIGGAKDIYGLTAPAATNAAQSAMDVAQRSGAQQEVAGGASLGLGIKGLASLFDPNYKEQQVQGALQAGREATREQLGQQNAMYGGAGGLGSSRQALADVNLRQLGEQRQGTAAAAASAGVEANRAAAAKELAGTGLQALTGAQQSAASRIGYAMTPQDVYAKYASVIYGTPQASTTPNFAGTQGTQTSGKSSRIG
jgi:hypothetical protein